MVFAVVAMVSSTTSLLAAALATVYPSNAFQSARRSESVRVRRSGDAHKLQASQDAFSVQECTKQYLDPQIASQFTVQVCTSTNCSRKLNQAGLDKYHALGEIYAHAQAANLEKAVIIEDGGCQGGKNCGLGPCVAVLHEDFVGNVALEGMGSAEFRERV